MYSFQTIPHYFIPTKFDIYQREISFAWKPCFGFDSKTIGTWAQLQAPEVQIEQQAQWICM